MRSSLPSGPMPAKAQEDDVFDKFDHQRVEQIIHLVSENNFGQIFITDTHEERMKDIITRINIDHKIFRITEKQQIMETS